MQTMREVEAKVRKLDVRDAHDETDYDKQQPFEVVKSRRSRKRERQMQRKG